MYLLHVSFVKVLKTLKKPNSDELPEIKFTLNHYRKHRLLFSKNINTKLTQSPKTPL